MPSLFKYHDNIQYVTFLPFPNWFLIEHNVFLPFQCSCNLVRKTRITKTICIFGELLIYSVVSYHSNELISCFVVDCWHSLISCMRPFSIFVECVCIRTFWSAPPIVWSFDIVAPLSALYSLRPSVRQLVYHIVLVCGGKIDVSALQIRCLYTFAGVNGRIDTADTLFIHVCRGKWTCQHCRYAVIYKRLWG